MSAPITSYLQVLQPQVYVRVEGKNLHDLSERIVQFSFTDNERKLDEMELTLRNDDFVLQDDLRFARGSRVSVRWGYPGGDVSDKRRMIITEITHSVGQSDLPLLVVRAFDQRRQMHRNCAPQNYGSVSSSAIAKKIAKKYGLGTKNIKESNDARAKARVQATDVTDLVYLTSLADKLHWDCYIESGQLHFHPKNLGASSLFTYTWNDSSTSTILSYSSSLNLKKFKKTGLNSTDPKKGESANSEQEQGGDKSLGSHQVDISTNFGAIDYFKSATAEAFGESKKEDTMTVPDGEALQIATCEAEQKLTKLHAQALREKIELRSVEADLEVIGTPKLRSRQNIRIKGVGKAYSGIWRVKSVKHNLNPGSSPVYSCSVELVRNALNVGTKKSKNQSNSTNNDEGTTDPNLLTITTGVGAIDYFESFSEGR